MIAATRARRDAVLAGGEIGLLGDILAGTPKLAGAACRGQGHLFDPAGYNEPADAVADRHSRAIELCARCPELARCADWLDSLPKSQRPAGVVAGELHPRPPGQPTKKGNHQ